MNKYMETVRRIGLHLATILAFAFIAPVLVALAIGTEEGFKSALLPSILFVGGPLLVLVYGLQSIRPLTVASIVGSILLVVLGCVFSYLPDVLGQPLFGQVGLCWLLLVSVNSVMLYFREGVRPFRACIPVLISLAAALLILWH